jgi:hypothetical protein
VTPRRLTAWLGLLALVAVPAAAQAPSAPVFSMAVKDVTLAVCVDFLMAPAIAAEKLPEGYRVIPASHYSRLSPYLTRIIGSDSAQRAMIPASYCVIEGASVTAGDQFITDGGAANPVLLAYWGIAAARNDGDNHFDELFAVQFWTSDWHIQKPAQSNFIQISTLKRSLVRLPESENDRYEVKMGKTVLSWDGQLKRDSVATTAPLEASLLYIGQRSIRFTAAVSGQPAWSRSPAGVFRVVGKDDLAKAMQASPIRQFGPIYWGGDARVDFSR